MDNSTMSIYHIQDNNVNGSEYIHHNLSRNPDDNLDIDIFQTDSFPLLWNEPLR